MNEYQVKVSARNLGSVLIETGTVLITTYTYDIISVGLIQNRHCSKKLEQCLFCIPVKRLKSTLHSSVQY